MSDAEFCFIESNTTGTGLRAIAAVKELGFRPVLLTADPPRYPFASVDVDTVLVDTANAEDCLKALSRRTVAVMSTSEYFVGVAAAVAARLGLPSLAPEAVSVTRHKHRQRVRLAIAGVPIPLTACVEAPEAAEDAARQIGLPVVVKPVSGSGSVGVLLCRTFGEVRSHAACLVANPVNERGHAVEPCVLVEEYVPGQEFSVELFGRTVVGVTVKHLGEPPVFIETGHDFPLRPIPRSIAETAQRAAQALGLAFGPLHVELRLGAAGPVVIEVNPRLAGGCIPNLVAVATGIDLVAQTIRAFCGGSPDLAPTRDLFGSIRFIVAPSNGVFLGLDGSDAAQRCPGVVEVSLYPRPGDVVMVVGDFRCRIGHVIATAADPVKAATLADQALGKLNPIVAQEGPG